MRMVAVTPDAKKAELLKRLFKAYWVDNVDVKDHKVLLKLAGEVGLHFEEAVFEGNQEAKDKLRKNTQEGFLAWLTFCLTISLSLNKCFNLLWGFATTKL